MKRTKRNVLLAFAASALCATALGGAGATVLANADTQPQNELSATNFLYKGASVRVIGEEITSGVRFRYAIEKAAYDGMLLSHPDAKTYVALSPQALLNGEEIDKDNAERVLEVTENWEEQEMDGQAYMVATVGVVDIPESYYASKIVGVAYALVDETPVYSSRGSAISMADVARFEWGSSASKLTPAQKQSLKDNYLTYTLTLHVDGSEAVKDEDLFYGDPYTVDAAAQKDGYVFKGWYNSDYSVQWINGETTVLGDTDLYAKYAAAITVKGEYGTYVKGQKVTVASAVCGDNSVAVNCVITDASGATVSVSDGAFTPTTAGTHKATYTCGDQTVVKDISVIGDISDGTLVWDQSLLNSLVTPIDGRGTNGQFPAKVSLANEAGKNAVKMTFNDKFLGDVSDSSCYVRQSYPGIEFGELMGNAVSLTSDSVVSFYVKLSEGFWGQQTGGVFITYNGVNCSTMSNDNGKIGIKSYVSGIAAEYNGASEFLQNSYKGGLLWTERSVCGVSGKAYMMQLATASAQATNTQWVKVTISFKGVKNPSLKGLRILYSSRNGYMYNRMSNGSRAAELTYGDSVYISDFEIKSK